MILFLVGPIFLASGIGVVALFLLRKRLGVEMKTLLPSFVTHILGWGLFIAAPLLVVTALTTFVMQRQSPLLPFAPWVFAAGEIVGLMRFRNKHKRVLD